MAANEPSGEPAATRQALLENALAHLAERHPEIRQTLEEIGPPEPRVLEPGFGALIRIIIGQQVSTASAAAILKRLRAAGGDDPQRFAAMGDDDLAAIGLSRAKMRYGRALAERVLDGRLDLSALSAAEPELAHEALIQVPGIGRWTAEIYRMFALGDPNVFPSGDLALREGLRWLMDLADRPTVEQTDQRAVEWAPHRSSVALLVWRLYRNRRGIAVLGADAKG